jgi:hypothetical protein
VTPDEIVDVLGRCALFDYRFSKPDAKVAVAWFAVLRDLDVNDALEAVVRYYADNTDRIMPAHIRQGVKAIQAERRRHQPAPARELPSRFEEDINRQVRMKQGAASLRQILEPLVGHVAATRPELPSAMDELRALTAGPHIDNDDDPIEGEVIR